MRIVFIGTGDIGLPVFQWLTENHEVVALVTQPDKPAGRKLELTPPRIKQEALARGITVYQPPKLRAPEATDQVRAWKAEVIVVMAYGQILPKGVLEAASVACLNLHASLLPRWRGAAPIQAAIEAGDEKTGLTVMYMDEGLDTGDILLMREMVIAPNETGGSLHDRLALESPGTLAISLALLESGRAPRVPQPAHGVTYAGKLTREHGTLDFTAGWRAVERKVRAMNPWPAAATTLDGKRLKVFTATPRPEQAGAPGEVLAGEDGVLVGTGDGGVLLTEVQLEGRQRVSGAEFVRGARLQPGMRLGT
jgi:methionyl-tRNA formyltransferase